MEKIYNYFAYGENHKIVLCVNSYRNNGTLAVLMSEVFDDGHEEPWSVLTVNLAMSDSMANKTDTQFVDTNNLGDEIIKWLEDNHIAVSTGLYAPSGWCVYPLVIFTKEALANMRRC